MTLNEIRASDKAVLTCEDIAEVLGSQPYTLHMVATDRPELLGFPVIVVGRRVKIPRLRFLQFMGVFPTDG